MRTSTRPGGPGAPPRRGDSRRPHPRRAVRPPQEWFAHQLLLVLSGSRPVHSLLGHVHAAAYDQLARLAPDAPLRAPGERGARSRVRRVGVCRPEPEVIEAFARIAVGERVRALAFRLDRTGAGRWLCSAVELDVAHGAAVR